MDDERHQRARSHSTVASRHNAAPQGALSPSIDRGMRAIDFSGASPAHAARSPAHAADSLPKYSPKSPPRRASQEISEDDEIARHVEDIDHAFGNIAYAEGQDGPVAAVE